MLMGWSEGDTLRRIREMPDAEREELRGEVDWVEDYERSER